MNIQQAVRAVRRVWKRASFRRGKFSADESHGVEEPSSEVERALYGFKYIGARVKTDRERINQKLLRQPANTISDYLGLRGSVGTLDVIESVIEELDKRFGVVQLEPFLSEPRYCWYFGVYAQIRMPNGSTAEFQILPLEIAQVKERVDVLYRVCRVPRISIEEYQRLAAEEKKILYEAGTEFGQRTGITDQDLERIQRKLELRYSHLLPAVLIGSREKTPARASAHE